MKALLDTNVLVAGLVRSHEHHRAALHWLEQARGGDLDIVVTQHALAELYVNLTRLPIQPRISPKVALQLIEDLLAYTQVVSLSVEDYRTTLQEMAARGLRGAVTYDGLMVRGAVKADVEILVTFNERDFRRVWPDAGDRIVVPE